MKQGEKGRAGDKKRRHGKEERKQCEEVETETRCKKGEKMMMKKKEREKKSGQGTEEREKGEEV